jgi:hypothetical protein
MSYVPDMLRGLDLMDLPKLLTVDELAGARR